MTPKEKAIELLDKYAYEAYNIIGIKNWQGTTEAENAISLTLNIIDDMIDVSNDANIDFLEKTKQEIKIYEASAQRVYGRT